MEFLSHINICDTSMTKKRVSKTMHLKPCFVTFICSCHMSMTLVLKSQSFMTFDFKSQLMSYHITGSFQFAFHFLAQIFNLHISSIFKLHNLEEMLGSKKL